MGVDRHRLAELRSLAYHEEISRRLEASEGRELSVARGRVEEWLASGAVAGAYARAWRELLSSPVEEIAERLRDPGERMTALRQCTPFAGALDPRTRWRLWRQVAATFQAESREPRAAGPRVERAGGP